MYNVIDLSNYIIAAFDERNAPITNLKLQKVLYYVQGYFMKFWGSEAFRDDVYCWAYGPVVPMAYFEYNMNGSDFLHPSADSDLNMKNIEKSLVDKIIDKCKDIPSSRLVSMTHSEFPWKNATIGDVIPKQSMRNFFAFADPLEIKR